MMVFDAWKISSNVVHLSTLVTLVLHCLLIFTSANSTGVGAENIIADEENETYVGYSEPHSLVQDVNATSGVPYSAEFISCMKWLLFRDEDFRIEPNNSILYLCNNYTYCHKFEYSPGYYKLSADGSTAYVCIPDQLNAYLYPADYVYVVFWCASLFFLVLSLVVHVWVVQEIRTSDVRPMFCHQLSLSFYYLFLVLINTKALGGKGCWLRNWANIGAYYTLRTAFAWLNVISFDMWRTLHPKRVLLHSQSVSKPTSFLRFFLQSLYSWGLPVLMLLSAYLLLYLPSPQTQIAASAGILYVNLAQFVCMRSAVTIIVLINAFFCTLVVFNLRRIRKDTARSKLVTAAVQESYSICLKIVVLSGFIWLIETVQWVIIRYEKFIVYWLIPDLLSCGGQGLWLFLIYCCNPSVLKATRKKLKVVWFAE